MVDEKALPPGVTRGPWPPVDKTPGEWWGDGYHRGAPSGIWVAGYNGKSIPERRARVGFSCGATGPRGDYEFHLTPFTTEWRLPWEYERKIAFRRHVLRRAPLRIEIIGFSSTAGLRRVGYEDLHTLNEVIARLEEFRGMVAGGERLGHPDGSF